MTASWRTPTRRSCHEVGVHSGMPQMLGPKLFAEVIAKVNAGLRSSKDTMFVKAVKRARGMVPDSTTAAHVPEETLAWLVTDRANHKLSLVKRILARLKAWAAKYLGVTRFLDADAVVELAVGAAMRAGETRASNKPLFAALDESVFYSAALGAVKTAKQAKQTPAQWLAYLKKSGVKQEEIEWIGIDEFLRTDNRNASSFPREDLEMFIRANKVTVEDVVKKNVLYTGENEVRIVHDPVAAREHHDTAEYLVYFTVDGSLMDVANSEEEARQIVADNDAVLEPPFYHIFETDDGVFTLVNELDESAKDPDGRSRWCSRRRIWRTNIAPRSCRASTKLSGKFFIPEYTEPGPSTDYTEILLRMPPGKDDRTFDAGHWNENNVLVHVRFNTRKDAAGNRVLFIEEIQSDWHQAGRARGYQEGEEKTANLLPLAGQAHRANLYDALRPRDGRGHHGRI